MKKTTKKERAEFLKKGAEMVLALGARLDPEAYRDGMYLLDTRYGLLHLAFCLGETMLWVATQFEEPKRAIGNVFGASLNPHSGKWNFNTDDLDYVKSHLQHVLPEPSLNCMVSTVPEVALAPA